MDADFASVNSLFGAVKLTKNTDPDKYRYSGYGIWFDTPGRFSLSNRFGVVLNGFGKNARICDAEMSSSVHIDNKDKDILILGKVPTDSLDDTTLIAEKWTLSYRRKFV